MPLLDKYYQVPADDKNINDNMTNRGNRITSDDKNNNIPFCHGDKKKKQPGVLSILLY